jgi:SOS-response transcriptional repressor LexA
MTEATLAPKPLTTQQQHVLNYLHVFFGMNDALPSAMTIASAFGYASGNAASELLLKLARKGYIEKNEVGGYRFTRTAA